MSAIKTAAAALAAVLLTASPMPTSAQTDDDPAVTSGQQVPPGPRRGMGMMGSRGMERGWRHQRRAGEDWRGPMRGQMMRDHMMGMGMMGLGGREMMMILMDSDGDGSVSREEFLDAHGRIFDYLDRDGSGQLDIEELFGRRAWLDAEDADDAEDDDLDEDD